MLSLVAIVVSVAALIWAAIGIALAVFFYRLGREQ